MRSTISGAFTAFLYMSLQTAVGNSPPTVVYLYNHVKIKSMWEDCYMIQGITHFKPGPFLAISITHKIVVCMFLQT